jgi:hypothetical protein
MELSYELWFWILIILIMVGGFFLTGFVLAIPDYFGDFSRSRKMKELAEEYKLQFEKASSFCSFMLSLRWFYTQDGAIHRHIVSGRVGDSQIEIYDSTKYVNHSRWSGGGEIFQRTIVKMNGKIIGDATPPAGYASTDDLREILEKTIGNQPASHI